MNTQTQARHDNASDATNSRRVAPYLRNTTRDDQLRTFSTTQQGWQIVATHSDHSSGNTLNRPGLHHALEAARAGQYDTLLVHSLDQISRRTADLSEVLDQLDRAGVTLWSASQGIHSGDQFHRMIVTLVASVIENAAAFPREMAAVQRAGGVGQASRPGLPESPSQTSPDSAGPNPGHAPAAPIRHM